MGAVPKKRRRAPAKDPEARENQLINLAYDYAEKQFEAGTASSQVTTHFLRLGSVKAKLELEKLKSENLLLEAKADAIQSAQRIEELYQEAIIAFASYQGEEIEVEDDLSD